MYSLNHLFSCIERKPRIASKWTLSLFSMCTHTFSLSKTLTAVDWCLVANTRGHAHDNWTQLEPRVLSLVLIFFIISGFVNRKIRAFIWIQVTFAGACFTSIFVSHDSTGNLTGVFTLTSFLPLIKFSGRVLWQVYAAQLAVGKAYMCISYSNAIFTITKYSKSRNVYSHAIFSHAIPILRQ